MQMHVYVIKIYYDETIEPNNRIEFKRQLKLKH